MNIKLLPNFEQIPPLSKNGKMPLLFYFFKLKEEDKEGIALRELMHKQGVKCLHWWTCEYTFIGEDDYWTHSAVFEIADKEAFLKAAKEQLSIPSVENVQLYFAKDIMPPKFILALFKLLRPLGILLDTNEKSTTEKVLSAFESEGGINPRRDQIERHLTNNRKSMAFMINLLQYRPKAIYTDPSPKESIQTAKRDITGHKAYKKIYGIVALRSVIMTGGHLAFAARLGAPIIENDAPKSTIGFWDDVIVMAYSDPSRLFSLKRMPGYGSALKHRVAGLLRTALLISE